MVRAREIGLKQIMLTEEVGVKATLRLERGLQVTVDADQSQEELKTEELLYIAS